MTYDYGYGELNNQLIEVFRAETPDFNKAKELISLGANINATCNEPYFQDENMLSEILLGFWETRCDIFVSCERENCMDCTDCLPDEVVGKKMFSIIKFFLDNGFDVSANNNMRGAQCLYALTLSTQDKYILPCAKLLLDAGAKDVAFYSDDTKTVSEHVSFESFCQSVEDRQDYSNILIAYYQILMEANEGRNYHNIDGFDGSYGKKITKVLALPEKDGPFFYDLALTEKTYHNCYNGNIYFVFDGGALVNTQYAEIWTDASAIPKNTIDVSEAFKNLCGATVSEITFDQRVFQKGTSCYRQPIIYIHMSNGYVFRTTINFGEVTDDQRAAYYEIIREEK